MPPHGTLTSAAIAASASCALLVVSCTAGAGDTCSHDSACAFGLACTFSDVATIDCCAVGPEGIVDCDPTSPTVLDRGIAIDCELNDNGSLKPKLRRASCLRAAFDDYLIYTGALLLDENMQPIGPEFVPIAKSLNMTSACTCEPGADFGGEEGSRYDPILALSPGAFACERPTIDNATVEPPIRADRNNDGVLNALDCTPAESSCPPCVAFP